MSGMMPPAKKAAGEYDAGATFHRIRITLTTSKSVANLEKVRRAGSWQPARIWGVRV